MTYDPQPGWQQPGQPPGFPPQAGWQQPPGYPPQQQPGMPAQQPATGGGFVGLLVAALLFLVAGGLWLIFSVLTLINNLTSSPLSDADKSILDKMGTNVTLADTLHITAYALGIISGLVLLVSALLLVLRNRSGLLLGAVGAGLGIVVLVAYMLTSLAGPYYDVVPPISRIIFAALAIVGWIPTLIPSIRSAVRPRAPVFTGPPPGQFGMPQPPPPWQQGPYPPR